MNPNSIHIGSSIKKRLEELGLSNVALAKLIHCCLSNITSLLNRSSIDTNHLCLISKALRFNFFRLYSDQLDEYLSTSLGVGSACVGLNARLQPCNKTQCNPFIIEEKSFEKRIIV